MFRDYSEQELKDLLDSLKSENVNGCYNRMIKKVEKALDTLC